MGTYLNDILLAKTLKNTFVFDLEYVGFTTNLQECFIWDIAIMNLLTGTSLSITVKPPLPKLPPPFSDDFIEVTHELLHERSATTFTEAFAQIQNFLGPHPCILISHNCFKSDKILLEIESRRHGITLPFTWLFFDSLIFCRKILPKMNSYTLNIIHNDIGLGNIENQHFALSDSIALRNILLRLDYTQLHGPIYPPYSTSLQAVKWLGPSSEHSMFLKNIRSVEQLLHRITTEFTQTALNEDYTPSLDHFTENFIVYFFGIKIGNAKSIANSLLTSWLKKL